MSDNNMNQMPDGMNPNGADGPQQTGVKLHGVFPSWRG